MPTKKRALGKGLNALLPAPPASVPTADRNLLDIAVERIVPNKHQPRTYFDPQALEELAQSIKSNGLVQPVVVRKGGADEYQLITGERRWRAAKLAGLKSIPAVVRDISEYKTLEWALIENIQRQDLNPLEEATAYASLMEDFQLTQEEVAQRVGKDRSSIANYIRLLKLPSEIKERIQKQELSMGHARAISSLEQAQDQLDLANRILQQQLNVRQAEALIRKWKENGHKPDKSEPRTLDANVRAAQQNLQERFGTKVSIVPVGKEGGKIEMHYQDNDDLIRIYDLLVGNQG